MKKLLFAFTLLIFAFSSAQEIVPLYDGYSYEHKTNQEISDLTVLKEGDVYYNIDLGYHVRYDGSSFVPMGLDDQNASEVENTPFGGVLSTNVQSAINEIDSKKATINGENLLNNSGENFILGKAAPNQTRIYVDYDSDEIQLSGGSDGANFTRIGVGQLGLYVTGQTNSKIDAMDSNNAIPTVRWINDNVTGTDNSLSQANQTIPNTIERKIILSNGTSRFRIENNNAERIFSAADQSIFFGDIPFIDNADQPTQDTELTPKKYVDDQVLTKQDLLVSGTNIKAINGNSIVGSGNLIIEATPTTDASTLITGVLENSVVQESNITQHEDALTITESQISDLNHPAPPVHTGEVIGGTNLTLDVSAISGQPLDNPLDSDQILYNDINNGGLLKKTTISNLLALGTISSENQNRITNENLFKFRNTGTSEVTTGAGIEAVASGDEGKKIWNFNDQNEDVVYTLDGTHTEGQVLVYGLRESTAQIEVVPTEDVTIIYKGQTNTNNSLRLTERGSIIQVTKTPFANEYWVSGDWDEQFTTPFTGPNILTQSNAATDDSDSTTGFIESFAPNSNISFSSVTNPVSGDDFMIEFVLDVAGQSGYMEISYDNAVIGQDYTWTWTDYVNVDSQQSVRLFQGMDGSPSTNPTHLTPTEDSFTGQATSTTITWRAYVSTDANGNLNDKYFLTSLTLENAN